MKDIVIGNIMYLIIYLWRNKKIIKQYHSVVVSYSYLTSSSITFSVYSFGSSNTGARTYSSRARLVCPRGMRLEGITDGDVSDSVLSPSAAPGVLDDPILLAVFGLVPADDLDGLALLEPRGVGEG